MELSKRVFSEAGEAAIVLLRLVQASSDVFPPLKSAAAGTLYIVELVKGFNSSKKEWAAFGEYVLAAALCVVDAIKSSSEPENDLETHAKRLNATLDSIAAQIVKLPKETVLKRFWSHAKAPRKIDGFKQDIRDALDLFHLKADMVTVRKLNDMPNEKDMRSLLKEMSEKFTKVVVEDIRIHDAVERLPHLIDASWDLGKICHQGTRVAIIDAIWKWIQEVDPTQSAGICLLRDIAGSGKSALAHSISARCDDEGVLFGTFFFDQMVETKARPTNLFSTLAYQLTKLGQDYTDTLGHILSENPLLYSPDQTRQFQKLILPAVKSAKRCHVRKPIVIVIDALDEGANETTLKILSELVPSLPGTFRFFITSRHTPEVDHYLANPLHVFHRSLDILEPDNRADLQFYVASRLPDVASYRHLETDWVTPQLITDFATKAEGLFIWAATVCEVLRDKNTFNPKAALRTLLYEEHDFGLPAEAKMAQLFDRILKSCNWSDEEFCQAFQQVIGTVATAKVPLSRQTLQQFCPDVPIERIFDYLMPVITGFDYTSQGVKFSHLSFLEHLTSRTRTEEPYYINPQMHESRLALLCLKTLATDLKAGSPGTGYLDSDVEGIPSVSEERIAQHVSYACRFWIDHTVEIRPDDDKLGAFLGCAATFLPGDNLIRWAELSAAIGQFVSLKFFVLWYSRVSKQEMWGQNEDVPRAYAKALSNLSLRLQYMVRLEEALAAFDEALTLRRQLATDRPAAFLPDLAVSLGNVSNCFFILGRREEALSAIQEALTIHRQLAIDRPAAFLPDLAASLGNVSNCLSDLGRREEALSAVQEALTICRQLATDRPATFLPELAMSLDSISSCLSDLGRHEEALSAIQEALAIRRQLATDHPAAFLPELAMSLNNVSLCLSDAGRREEALSTIQEAVTIHRQLAINRPAAFLPGLATSLGNVSNCLSDVGRRDEALSAIQEALTICRKLAIDRPAAFLPGLAMSLGNVSNQLSDVGRRDEALSAIQEALTIHRQLAIDRPAAFLPILSKSLHNVSLHLSAVGRQEEALFAIQEALTIRRQLAIDHPAAFLPDLASSLNIASICLSNLGRYEEALVAIREAVTIRQKLAEDRPAVFSRPLMISLRVYSECLSSLGREDEAQAIISNMSSIQSSTS